MSARQLRGWLDSKPAALRALQFSGAKRPFSGAIPVGMARLGGFDPEFPVENGTRHAHSARSPWPGGKLYNLTRHMKTVVCRGGQRAGAGTQAAGAAEGQGGLALRHPNSGPIPEVLGRLWGRSEAKVGRTSTGDARRRVQGIRNSLTTP